jgi:GT2 family glycosyltransferase
LASFVNLYGIVINWNSTSAQLAVTIRALDKSLSQARLNHAMATYHIHLWDNNSSNFVEPNTEISSRLQITRCAQNLGFAAGNNRAQEKNLASDWLLLINPDAMPHAEAVTQVLNAAQKFPDFSVFGFSLYATEKSGYLDGLGDIVHASGLCWRDGFDQPISALKDWIEPYETFAVCAAALLIRRDVFEVAGGFDEDFFCYQEDVARIAQGVIAVIFRCITGGAIWCGAM